jgi:hypothetical protein
MVFLAALGWFSGKSRRHGRSPHAAEGQFFAGNAGFGSSPKRLGLPNLLFTAIVPIPLHLQIFLIRFFHIDH